MHNEASIVIDRGIEDVFRLTTKHVSEWSIVVVEDEVVEDQDNGGVGTKFHTVTEDRGQRMDFDGLVTQHDPPHFTAIEMRGKSFAMNVQYRFEEIAGQTRVTQSSQVTGKGFFKVFLTLFGWMMKKSSCRATENELESLKAFCEGDRG